MKDLCHTCGKEYELRSEAGEGVCDACRFSVSHHTVAQPKEPKTFPYVPNERMNSRRAYVRERDLSNGAHIRLARFVEKGSDGEFGINITYLSPVKDGKRTELKFALSDEAAAMTCAMLSEFFGIDRLRMKGNTMYDIILTGRIKGDPQYKLHFAQAVVKMKTWRPQASIWNPAILPEGREYGWYIRQCVHALMDKAAPGCILVRRKGWNKGFGSVALWALARCIGMPVLDEWKL